MFKHCGDRHDCVFSKNMLIEDLKKEGISIQKKKTEVKQKDLELRRRREGVAVSPTGR